MWWLLHALGLWACLTLPTDLRLGTQSQLSAQHWLVAVVLGLNVGGVPPETAAAAAATAAVDSCLPTSLRPRCHTCKPDSLLLHVHYGFVSSALPSMSQKHNLPCVQV